MRRLLAGNANKERLTAAVQSINAALLESARAILEEYGEGRPMPQYEVTAARAITTVFADAEPLEAATLTVALALLRHGLPRRFVSERAYLFQVARRFRLIADTYVAAYPDARTGGRKRVYRECTPRAMQSLGETLVGAYSRLAGHVLLLAQRTSKATLNDAIDAAFA